jgi:hypothetical protein
MIFNVVLLELIFRYTCTGVRRKCCEEGVLPDEAISVTVLEIALGERTSPLQ